MTITGIDVSNYQSATYSLTGVDFVFVKATEGVSYTNPKHAAQVARARNAGLVVGHYAYLTASSSMTAQMDYFLKQAVPAAGELLAVDWEESGVSCAEKDQAIKYLIGKAGGRRVLLYCSQSYWTTRDTSSYAGDGLWVAQYNGKPGQPSIQAAWVMHQYTSDPIDTSVAAFGSRAEMAAWAAGEDDPMAAITKQDIFDAVWATDAIKAPADASDIKTNPTWQAQSILRDVQARVRALTTAEAAQTAALTKLAELVGSGVDTATVVAAVQDAIAKAVVHVDVAVTGTES